MTEALRLPHVYRRDTAGFGPRIRAIAGTLAADHALALRASAKASLHRRNLQELRGMYAQPLDPYQETDSIG